MYARCGTLVAEAFGSRFPFKLEPTIYAFAEHYHWLREFAVDHREAGAILAAID